MLVTMYQKTVVIASVDPDMCLPISPVKIGETKSHVVLKFCRIVVNNILKVLADRYWAGVGGAITCFFFQFFLNISKVTRKETFIERVEYLCNLAGKKNYNIKLLVWYSEYFFLEFFKISKLQNFFW